MIALLHPGETLTLGLNVIVRPGQWVARDPYEYAGTGRKPDVPCLDEASARATASRLSSSVVPWTAMLVAPQDWVALTGPCPTCDGNLWLWPDATPEGRTRCPDCRDGRRIVPLYTECQGCGGRGEFWYDEDTPGAGQMGAHWQKCTQQGWRTHYCNGSGQRLVGRGWIEVVPVVRDMEDVGGAYEGPACIEVNPATGYCRLWPAWSGALEYDDGTDLTLDPLPVPGRDFGIVIDCIEVAP